MGNGGRSSPYRRRGSRADPIVSGRAPQSGLAAKGGGDDQGVGGEHGGTDEDLEARATAELAALHPATAKEHADPSLDAGTEFLRALDDARLLVRGTLGGPRGASP